MMLKKEPKTFGPKLGKASRTLCAAVCVLALAGCDAIDPTQVSNPTTTDEDLAQAGSPTKALLPGLRAQFARMINAYVVAEVITDNYSIHGTGIVVDMDNPSTIRPDLINATGTSVSGIYWNVQELRALADFVINEIAPADSTASAAHTAEAHYYRGMAFLTMGEVFVAVPHEEDGAPQPAPVSLNKAVADLRAATAFGAQATAALARAYRLMGNASAAEVAANTVLNAAPDLLFVQEYDNNFLINTSVAFLVIRALQEMQPLPRLDFLDPKYTTRGAAIPIAKAEEMRLILGEVALADGDLSGAAKQLEKAINLVGTRDMVTFDDKDERRNADLTFRPRDSVIVIRADAESPFRTGLVLDRPADDLEIPAVSGTSLNADSVAALDNANELWHALWLARQEILLLEGRRLADLQIKLPMMLREIDQNDNISEGDPGTVVEYPSWLPVQPPYAMDIYTPMDSLYDSDKEDAELKTTEVTISVDMNRILTENRASPFQN